jgi:fluoroacetyl-CoA thioesterase
MATPDTHTTLAPGLTQTFAFVVPETKTVPHLYPESPEFQSMPRVFATGFLVGLVEWACMLCIQHDAGPDARSVGTDVKLSHTAATPPGLTVTVTVRLEAVEGRRLVFSAVAHDGIDEISRGTHERFLIDPERFAAKVAQKQERAQKGG